MRSSRPIGGAVVWEGFWMHPIMKPFGGNRCELRFRATRRRLSYAIEASTGDRIFPARFVARTDGSTA